MRIGHRDAQRLELPDSRDLHTRIGPAIAERQPVLPHIHRIGIGGLTAHLLVAASGGHRQALTHIQL